MKLERGSLIANRYAVIQTLGRGGMANVYKAKDRKLDRLVTVKVMREDLDASFAERFHKEAQSVARLAHPNIVKVFDYGEDDDLSYIVMEYADCLTLKELIAKSAPFEEENVLSVAAQIAAGLICAHKNNVVHRDIKPANILVMRDGAVKIADFGIARASNVSTVTNTMGSMGSVHYFSPEQARGGFVDFKSDIYSLGITMYEMATGCLPYEGDIPVAVAMKHVNEDIPLPSSINPDCSERLDYIIAKACERNTNLRYADARTLRRDIKSALRGDDVDVFLESSPTVAISEGELEEIRESVAPAREFSIVRHDDRAEEPLVMPRFGRKIKRKNNYKNHNSQNYRAKNNLNKYALQAGFFVSGCCAFLITALCFAVYYSNLPEEFHPPYLIGLTEAQASELAQEYGLNVAVFHRAFDPELSAGVIIDQMPGTDAFLRKNEVVHVVVSLGTEFFLLPQTVPTFVEDALYHLRARNLEVEIIEIYNKEYPEGVVVRSEPEGGTEVNYSVPITLYVSMGPPEENVFVMPFLGDMTVEEARAILDEIGLIIGEISEYASLFIPQGRILSQSIELGEIVEPGDIVDISVSLGGVLPSSFDPPPNLPEDVAPPQEELANELETPSTAILNLMLWPVDEDTESVHVRAYSQDEETEQQLILDVHVNVDSFPFPISVSGRGLTQFTIFSIEADGSPQMRARESIDFD